MMRIPERGCSKEAVLDRLAKLRARDLTETERTFAYVYDAGREAKEIGLAASSAMAGISGLDPTVYPSVLALENEVVAMASSHLGATPGVAGSFTSGGTESILLAVKSARDWAREQRPSIARPRMILPITAHPAHLKAAHLTGVQPIVVPVGIDAKADAERMAAAIDEDTIMMIGSAPSYAHGVIDPIAELGAIAEARGLWLHVDACIGGFLLPYFRRLGDPIPPFDFSIPGVSSLSMDLHKYAYAPKGASVLLYRSKALRRHQLFVHTGWPGYPLINTTLQSTKSAGPLAGAWAVLRFLGDEGLLDLARKTRAATHRLIAGIEAIDGLSIPVKPEMSLIAIASSVNPFVIADEMKNRRWYLQPQLRCEPFGATLHLSVHPGNHDWIDPFLADLQHAVSAARERPLDPATLDLEVVLASLGAGLPQEMAVINSLLDTLPPDLAAQLIGDFANDLFVPASEET